MFYPGQMVRLGQTTKSLFSFRIGHAILSLFDLASNGAEVREERLETVCPSCHGPAGDERFRKRVEILAVSGHAARYYWCPRCHLIFQFPQFQLAALSPAQQTCEAVSQNPLGTGRLTGFLGRFYYRFARGWFFAEVLKRYKPDSYELPRNNSLSKKAKTETGRLRARLLDVGAGIGLFCRIAGEWFETVGLEPSFDACQIGHRDLGVDCLVCGNIAPHLFREKFEIVTFWQTIEHISGSPREALLWAAKRLSPGGLLFLGEIPDFTSFEFSLFKGECRFLSSPLHNFLFSPRFFEETLREAGFTEIRIRHDWRNYSLFSQSLLGWLERRLGCMFPAKLMLVLSVMIMPFVLVFNLFLARKGRSATFSVMAIR
ncbi:MAG: methyltransferase domain-containing protein [Candidatus Ozemobacteraceae bacterium]